MPAPEPAERGIDMSASKEKKENGMGVGWFLVIIVAWVLLQAVILPKMGIST